jgi:hypothetical protein
LVCREDDRNGCMELIINSKFYNALKEQTEKYPGRMVGTKLFCALNRDLKGKMDACLQSELSLGRFGIINMTFVKMDVREYTQLFCAKL